MAIRPTKAWSIGSERALARREHWLGESIGSERALARSKNWLGEEHWLGESLKTRTVAIKPDRARYSLDSTEMLVKASVLDTAVRAQNAA